MENNPQSDGKIHRKEALVRAAVLGVAIAVVWNAPYDWVWRVAILVAIMVVLAIIYPRVRLALARRKQL